MNFHEIILNGFQLKEREHNYCCPTSKGNNSKKYTDKLHLFISSHHLMMLYISVKFHENILKAFFLYNGNETSIGKFQRRITPNIYRQELRFLSSATRLMMFDISMKFPENTQTYFRINERTRNYYCQISMENNSKNI